MSFTNYFVRCDSFRMPCLYRYWLISLATKGTKYLIAFSQLFDDFGPKLPFLPAINRLLMFVENCHWSEKKKKKTTYQAQKRRFTARIILCFVRKCVGIELCLVFLFAFSIKWFCLFETVASHYFCILLSYSMPEYFLPSNLLAFFLSHSLFEFRFLVEFVSHSQSLNNFIIFFFLSFSCYCNFFTDLVPVFYGLFVFSFRFSYIFISFTLRFAQFWINKFEYLHRVFSQTFRFGNFPFHFIFSCHFISDIW